MNALLTQDDHLALLVEASRAPSVHNTQPACWRLQDDGRIWLFEDTQRRLPVGDPSGRDHAISLGAAFEGLHLALSRHGLGLAPPQLEGISSPPQIPAHLKLYGASWIVPGGRDALADYVNERVCYRAVFRQVNSNDQTSLAEKLRLLGDLTPITRPADINEIASLNDHYSEVALGTPAYQAELYQWMRFLKSDPAWARDGLNADGLALNRSERFAAALLLHPQVFKILMRLRLGRFLIAESSKTRSAAAIAVFTTARQQHPFHIGRRFYRVWLEITRAGYSLCPMSVLADSEECSRHIRNRWSIADERNIINVFRIGKPAFTPTPSPRLPVDEIMV